MSHSDDKETYDSCCHIFRYFNSSNITGNDPLILYRFPSASNVLFLQLLCDSCQL